MWSSDGRAAFSLVGVCYQGSLDQWFSMCGPGSGLASPGDILEMQVLGFQCRSLESDSRVGPSNDADQTSIPAQQHCSSIYPCLCAQLPLQKCPLSLLLKTPPSLPSLPGSLCLALHLLIFIVHIILAHLEPWTLCFPPLHCLGIQS